MNVETLIYAYLAICAGMIVFNCACVFIFRSQEKRLSRNGSRMEAAVIKQVQHIRSGEPVDESHKAFLRKKLVYTSNLQAFDEALERLLETEPENARMYISEIRQVFIYLATENQYRNTMKLTYYVYVLRKYRIMEGRPVPMVMELLLELLQEPSLYCRESALQAIYNIGDCEYVLRALQIVDGNRQFHHAKLLTDGLLTFSGDRRELVQTLWPSFEDFSVSMRVVILDFIRFGGVDWKEEILMLLADSHSDDEICFSCIRYFGKYPSDRAYPLLIDFVERSGQRRWEYAAIAASALASYPGERTIDALKKALSSSSWYVRFNSAKSLEHFQLTYLDLSDVMDSNDRYAREILQYQMSLKKAAKEKEAVQV